MASSTLTLNQLARVAGPSRSTAARAVDGSPRARAESSRSVERAVEGLDYPGRPRTSGRDATTPTSVAVVFTEPTVGLLVHPYFAPLLKGIYNALAERSIMLVMLTTDLSRDIAVAETFVLDMNVDGAIVVSLHGDNPLTQHLVEHRTPTIVCGRTPRGVDVSCIDSDNRQGAALAVSHLIDLGRRRIATIAGNLDMASTVERLAGYREALAAAGILLDPTYEEVGDYHPDRAVMAMERLLLNHPDVGALFAHNDMTAAAAMKVLRQAQRRVPEDVAVIGFDDSPFACATEPQLSSIRQPNEEIGREAVNMLLREMADPAQVPSQIVLTTELVVRESTIGVEAAEVSPPRPSLL